MASESTSPADLSAIPSSVSGDGTTFVKGLKKYLEKYDTNVDAKISNIGEGSVAQVTGLTLTLEHKTNANGNINNIRVTFLTDNVPDYSFAQIWMKKQGGNVWELQGITKNLVFVIEDVPVGTYVVKVVACNSNAGTSDFNSAPSVIINVVLPSLVCNTPTQFYWSREDNKWHWGGYVDNGETSFFELRVDQNAGEYSAARLDFVPAGTYFSTVAPPSRSGTAYLYVCNNYGVYNTPAVHQYNTAAPVKPNKPTLEVVENGVKVTLQGLPSGCINYVVDVDGVEYEVLSSPWTSYTFFGSITVKYCFVDNVGRGPWSDSNTITTGRQITSTEITDGAITSPKIYSGEVNANKIQTANLASNCITADKLQTGSVEADKIATNAIIIGGDSDNGKVVINDNGISGDKIQANTMYGDRIIARTLSANSLKSENIALTGALSITGGGVTLDQNGLKLVGSDSSYTLFNEEGINYYDAESNTPYAQVKKMIIGVCADGKYVKFKTPWAKGPSNVMCMPMDIQTNDVNHANANMNIICQAREITRYGFYVDCYLNLGPGSYSYVARNLSAKTSSTTTYNSVDLTFTLYGSYGYNFIINATTILHTIPITVADTKIEMNVNATASMKYDVGKLGYSNANTGGCTAKNSKYSIAICDENMNILVDSGTFNGHIADGEAVGKNFTLSASFASGKTVLYVVARTQSQINIYERASYNDTTLAMFQNNKELIAQKVFSDLTVNIPSYKYTSGGDSKLQSGTAMFMVTDGSTNLYDIYDSKPADT